MIKKISIIGSGGVGSTLGFNVINRLAPQELVLIDTCSGLAKGVALDLEDTRGILNFSTKIIGSQDYSDIKSSDIVVHTAGIARRKGMTRLDLLKINSKIAKEVSKKIKKFAPSAIVIVVANPLDLITYIVTKETGFSRKKVIGMGSSLDTSRLLNILHNSIGISTAAFNGFVYGAHSKDMIVDTKKIKVAGQSLDTFMRKQKVKKIKRLVQLRGAQIVSYLKTKSANFAPSLACCSLIEAIAYNQNQIHPVSIYLKGEYGLKDVCIGVPCLINRNGVKKIIKLKLSPEEKRQLKNTQKIFKECMI